MKDIIMIIVIAIHEVQKLLQNARIGHMTFGIGTKITIN